MATINITLSQKTNNPPTANAGSDQMIAPPATSVTLIGSGSDTDGTIVSYQWVKTSGPSCTIVSPNSSTTEVDGMNTSDVYVFQLTVTDNLGATGYDSVSITKQVLTIYSFKFIVDPSSQYCLTDEDDNNTGYSGYHTVLKVSIAENYPLDVNNNKVSESGLSQDFQINDGTNSGYIAPSIDEDACPILIPLGSLILQNETSTSDFRVKVTQDSTGANSTTLTASPGITRTTLLPGDGTGTYTVDVTRITAPASRSVDIYVSSVTPLTTTTPGLYVFNEITGSPDITVDIQDTP